MHGTTIKIMGENLWAKHTSLSACAERKAILSLVIKHVIILFPDLPYSPTSRHLMNDRHICIDGKIMRGENLSITTEIHSTAPFSTTDSTRSCLGPYSGPHGNRPATYAPRSGRDLVILDWPKIFSLVQRKEYGS